MTAESRWSISIEAPRETIWSALTRLGEPQSFYFDSVLDTELRPGAKLRYLSADRSRTFIEGEVLLVDAPSLFAHSFRFTDLDEPAGRVDYLLEAEGRGTRVTVLHSGLGPEHYQAVTPGWAQILGELKTLAEQAWRAVS